MILHEIYWLLKSSFLKFTVTILWLILILLKSAVFVLAKFCKFIATVCKTFIFIFNCLVSLVYDLFFKVTPFIVVFIVQSVLDILTLLILLVIKTQSYVIKIQQHFLYIIHSLHNGLKWQRVLLFHLMFNRFLRTVVKKQFINLVINLKSSLIGYTKISIKRLLKKFTLYFSLTVYKLIIKGEKNIFSTLKQIYLFVISIFRFIINSCSLVFLILSAFYNCLVGLLSYKTYKSIILKLYFIIKLVLTEIFTDIKLISKFFIISPYITKNLTSKLFFTIKDSVTSLFYLCKKHYLKTTFLVIVGFILTFNLNLLIKNNKIFLTIAQSYQSNLSVTNTVPTFISVFNNLKINSLVKYKKITLSVKDFKELNQELLKFNIDSNEAQQIFKAIYTASNGTSLPLKGGDVQAIFLTSKLDKDSIKVAHLEIPLNNNYDLIVEPTNNKQQYNVYKKKKELTKYLVKQKFVIGENYYSSAYNSKLPSNIISILSNLMSWHIDFQRELNTGDSIEVLYQCLYNKNKLISCNSIIYADIKLSHKSLVFYNYDGKYYLANGRSAATALLRTPIEGYRVSSPFGRRSHPILGYSIFHKGVDFAAPTGTPIPTAGNGIVKKIAISNSYGKYIEIQHNTYLSTVYAHLNAFAKGLYVGQKVSQRQIIGYAGATGWATGPHLHYEIHFNGKPVNPMDVRIPSSYYLTDENLKYFNKYKKEVNQILLKLPLDQKASITFNSL